MLAIRQLYPRFIAILPSTMCLENWNSIATLVWTNLRKLLSCAPIFECVNANVNGPPTSKYDPRDVASDMTVNQSCT